MEHSQLNGMEAVSLDDQIAASRERYMTAVSDALDAELSRFLLPCDRVALLEDFTLFSCFLGALKTAEVQTPAGALMDRKDPLRAWWKIGKAVDKEVAVRLLEYGREAEAAQVKGTGDAAS